MDKKLASLLTKRTFWRSLFKTAVFVLLLFFTYGTGFSVWAVVLSVAVLAGLYFSESPERKISRASFWFLIFFSFGGLMLLRAARPNFFGANALALFLLSPAFTIFLSAVLFFLILGLNETFFRRRETVYVFLNSALLVFLFLLFNVFYQNPLAFFLLFFLTAVLLKESFGVFGSSSGRRDWLAAGLLALLTVEAAWFSGFLPLGFINAAAFLALFTLIGRDAYLAHRRGLLDRSFVLREAAFFAVLTIILFAVSPWTT